MSKSLCPNDNCLAANPEQRLLNEYAFKKITGLARKIIEESQFSAKRCQHCGIVYVTELRAAGPDKVSELGFLESTMHGEGWKPFDRYK